MAVFQLGMQETEGARRGPSESFENRAGPKKLGNVTMVETGFPGKPKRNMSREPGRRRLGVPAGSSAPVKKEFCAQVFEHLFHKVIPANRYAAAE